MKKNLTLAVLLTATATAAFAGPIEEQIRFRQSAYSFAAWNVQKIKNQVVDHPETFNKDNVAAAANAFAQDSLFPRVPGWNVSMESRVYDANDLWDIIDGAADLYLEYVFDDLHIARYTTGTHREVKAELYRHRDAENAFGIYAAERSPENNFISIGSLRA